MAATAIARASGRWLNGAFVLGAAGAILAPVIGTGAVLLALLSFATMRTTKNLERAFAAMLPCFEGNETEQNWTQRQQSVDELRKLTKSETPKDFPVVYLAGIKLLLDGIIKSAESLRTTLSTNSCRLIKELAIELGSALDPTMLEKLLPSMISLCGHTKSLNKKNGDETVSAIVSNVPVTYRIIQHISASSTDKNFSTRMCTAGWLKIVIEKNGRHCEQHSGLDLIDQCIRTGLQDAKLDVRGPMRDTYWTFARVWPDRAESIMSSLDAKAQKTLDQHPNKLRNIVPTEIKVATTHTTSKSTVVGPTKPSIKDIRLAAMRARTKAATETSTTENDDEFQSNYAASGAATQNSLNEPPSKSLDTFQPEIKATTHTTSKITVAGPVKPSVKDAKLASMRAKAARTNEDGGITPQNPPQEPIRAPTETSDEDNAKGISAPNAAPTAAPQTAIHSGPRSTFTVTVGPIRNPSQPTLSAAPKRALLSSAPVRRPRRQAPADEPLATSTLSQSVDLFAAEAISAEAIPAKESQRRPTLVNEPPAAFTISDSVDLVTSEAIPAAESQRRPAPLDELSAIATFVQSADLVAAKVIPAEESQRRPAPVDKSPAIDTAVQSADLVAVEPITSVLPTVSGQENEKDALTHKHTWNNKELAERRRSISPRSKDPEEARKLLARGIDRIKSRSIDDHGYRKLQGLINYHDRIFQDEHKYDDMLLALLDALETPNTEKRAPLGRRFDNKFQILVTIRLMFVHNRKYFAAYFPRAMSALVTARRNFESRNHIVSGLEETAQDITAVCIPPDVIDAVMDVLETEERDEAGSRTIAMGLHILSGLSARTRALHAPLDPLLEKRMAKFALNCLRQPTSIVRRAVIEYCLELKRIITPEARFFRLVTGDVEDFKNLITYYAANSVN